MSHLKKVRNQPCLPGRSAIAQTAALTVWVLWALCGCTATPEPIYYGTDQCQFCMMTIVDNRHAAQAVTLKGKNFKYDAIECMVRHVEDEAEYGHLLVSDYAEPGKLLNALNARFLISAAIPSPMGANLSAFTSDSSLGNYLNDREGEKLTWEQLKERLK